MKNKYSPNLEVEEDIGFEKKNWIAERIAWVILTLFVLAALAGVFGRGGISSAKAGSAAEGMEIEYQRFLRYHTSDNLQLLVHNAPKNGSYSLTVSNTWLDKVQVEEIQPKPSSETATANGIEYTFDTAPGNYPLRFTFYFKPQKMGSAELVFSGAGGASVSVSQFIYP